MAGWSAQFEQQPCSVASSASQLTAGGRHFSASSVGLCVRESATVGLPDIVLECDLDVVSVPGDDAATVAYGSAAPTARLGHSRWRRVTPSVWRLGPSTDRTLAGDPWEMLHQRDRVRAFFAVASECSRTGGLLVIKFLDTDPTLIACWEMAGFSEAVEEWLAAFPDDEARWAWMHPRLRRSSAVSVAEIADAPTREGPATQGTLF